MLKISVLYNTLICIQLLTACVENISCFNFYSHRVPPQIFTTKISGFTVSTNACLGHLCYLWIESLVCLSFPALIIPIFFFLFLSYLFLKMLSMQWIHCIDKGSQPSQHVCRKGSNETKRKQDKIKRVEQSELRKKRHTI